MNLKPETIFGHLVDHVTAHPGRYLLTALLLTILSVVTIVLRFDIKSDLKDLLPSDAQVVKDIDAIADRMGSVQTLTVFLKIPELQPLSEQARQGSEYQECLQTLGDNEHIFRDPPIVGENWCDNPLMLFARRYVSLLETLDSIGNISFVNDKSFFEKNALLYASNEELQKIYTEIDEALTEARHQSGEYKTCLIVADDPSECEDLRPGLSKTSAAQSVQSEGNTLDRYRQQLVERYESSELSSIHEFPFYPMPNNAWMIAIEIRFKKSTTGLKSVQNQVKLIEEKLKSVDMAQYDPRIEIEYGGGLSEMKTEYNAIVVDIVRSISSTILCIFLLISIFFRSPRAAFRIFTPLIMGTLCALGITFLTIGYLNLITAFIFAILVGLGIDFGIHLYARYINERRKGRTLEEAIRISIVETGSPLFFGAMTTAVAFYALMFGSFPGFSQFGFVAGTGVLLSFLTMCTVMPALILLLERRWPSKIRPAVKRVELAAETKRKLSTPLIAASLLGLIFAGWCASQIPDLQFEGNFYNLKFKNPPSAQTTVKTETFVKSKYPASPTVAILDNLDQVEYLELLLKRDREYVNYHLLRRSMMRMPHTTQYLNDMFAEVMPHLGIHRSLPMFSALARTFPDLSAVHSNFPIFTTYGREKSRALRLYRDFAMKLPNTAAAISDIIPEALAANTVANALPVVSGMTQTLPKWLWPSIPTQRSSQQYNVITEYASIFSYLPGTQQQQLERLQTIARIRERTEDRQIRFLPDEEKEKIRQLRSYLVDKPLTIDDLPEWAKLQFKESGEHPLPPRPESGVDYAFGNILLMYQRTSTYVAFQADYLVHDVRSLRVDGKRLTAATGAFVYSDMIHLVKTDGVRIAIVALSIILLLAMLQQRNIGAALVVTLPVLSGLAVTLEIMIQANAALGLFNIVMLPVTLGIGIDGAIYLYDRYRMLGRGSTFAAVRAVIGSVFMSSSTTLVGFGGMILSQHRGLNSMGVLAVIGISTCFVTTFLLLPGLLLLAERLNIRGIVPDHDYVPEGETAVTNSEAAA
ncbi:MAG: MMPL family transporter [Proteobacteria bacterium]|nr:MMPL family transporter [Pseudomonadota bacterium]